MNSVVYLSCSQLSCSEESDAPLVVCLKESISLLSGNHTIPGILLSSVEVNDDCSTGRYWRYTISYDPELLTDPSTLLTNADIVGIFCEDTCFLNYIKELIAAA